jgi:hypothetical protein
MTTTGSVGSSDCVRDSRFRPSSPEVVSRAIQIDQRDVELPGFDGGEDAGGG